MRFQQAAVSTDEGMSLIETVVALFIVAVVMTSSGLFFVNGLKHGGLQNQRQTAVSLANQALESAQAVEPAKLLAGRTQSEVTALLGTAGAGALTAQDITSSGNWDATATAPGGAVVPLSRTQTVSGQAYLLRTFINQCYISDTASKTCTQAAPAAATSAPVPVLRVTVAATWTPKTVSCAGGCSYVASALMDTQGDPKFNSNVSHPQITKVTPSAVVVGQTRTLIVEGSGFLAGATVQVPGAGGTTGTPANNTGTSLTVAWTTGSTPGSYGLSVVNPDGGRATYAVTVTPPPVITGASPSTLPNGVATTVTLTGSGFQAGAQVSLTSGTATSASFLSSTSMTVSLTSTQTGPATVTVTNPDGGVGTSTITVKAPPPTITNAQQGAAAGVNRATTVTLTGTDFLSDTTVSASTGTVNSVALTGSTTATVTFTPSAAGAATTFTLATSSGSASATLTIVTLPPPTVTASSQAASAPVGTARSVTLTGTGFAAGMTVGASTGSLSNVTLSGTTSVTFSFTPTAANASTTFTVTTGGGSATWTTTIGTAAPPTVTAVGQSSSPPVGSSTTVTLTGTGFTSGMTVAASTGTLAGATVTGTTSVSFTFTPSSPNASTTFTVTTGGGSASASRVITTAPAPTISTMTNTYKKNTTPNSFTITGTGFTSTPTSLLSVSVAGTGFGTTGTVMSWSSTSIVFSVMTPGGAQTNIPVKVTVRIADGQTVSYTANVSTV